jgi:hypothetical protein
VIYLRLLWAIVTFLMMGLIKVALLDFPGLLLVYIGIKFGGPRFSVVAQKEVFNPPRWLWLWGNDEEGYDAPKSYVLWPKDSDTLRRWLWAAYRNRTDNLQFSFWCPPSVPGKVWVYYFPWGGFICGQGLLCYVWTPLGKDGRAVSFGWNHYPTDNAPLEPGDPRRLGCGYGWRWTPKGGHLT